MTSAVRTVADLAYAEPVGRGHLLDLHLPAHRGGPFPTVVFHAGSAWFSDDTKGGPPPGMPPELAGATTARSLAERWCPRGYAVVGLNVRSSAQARFPAQLHDVKAALRFLRASAATYDLDPGRFATMGTSSGGWVSSMAAVTQGRPELEGDLGHAGESSAVQACIDLFGPTDFLQMDAHRVPGGLEHDPADSPESRLIGRPIQDDPDAVSAANPCRYVTAGAPPLFAAHGLADPLVPSHQSELLFAAYARAGAPATLVLVPDVGHTETYLLGAERSAGRTVRTTRDGAVTEGSEPAPTYDVLLDFLESCW